MSRVSPRQHSFNRGALTRRLHGNQNLELYYTALWVVRNYVITGHGIMERRPAFEQLGHTKNDGPATLYPFAFDPLSPYTLELGEMYLRAWFGDGLVLDGGSPSETATPYTAAEAEELSTAQEGDFMWVAHRNHQQATIVRNTPNTFTHQAFETKDGPYEPPNTDEERKLSVAVEPVPPPPTAGLATFASPGIPAGITNGSVITVNDGTEDRVITCTAAPVTDTIQTNWTGADIPATTNFTYDGGTVPPAGTTIQVNGANPAHIAKISASGHAPFDPARDVGRWVRILEENEAAAPSAELEERFKWHAFKITSVTDNANVLAEWDGETITGFGTVINPTSTWRLGAFYEGSWPRVVGFHQDRLVLAVRNRVFFSSPDDFPNFAPSDPDSSVNPDNGFSVRIPVPDNKKASVSDVLFVQSLGFQLVVGTAAGLHTIQATTFGDSLTPETVTRRTQDSRGASAVPPVLLGESVLFGHKSGRKFMGTYYRDTFDRIGAQDLSLPADELTTGKIKQTCWQEEPHSIAWIMLDDGELIALTVQPEEQVQAWHVHTIGGSFIENGIIKAARVESIATRPSSEGDDRVMAIIKRTVDGATVRHVERMRPFRRLGEDPKEAWFLDGSTRYEGNTDAAKTITFTGTGVSARAAVTNFATPAFTDGQHLSFHDGMRWHRGVISAVDGSNNFTWTPITPNAGPGPADGRWHHVNGSWVQLTEDDEIDIYAQTYVPPANQTAVARWSQDLTTGLSGIDLEGEEITVMLDGRPTTRTVAGGQITDLGQAHIITLGFPYVPYFKLLPIEAGSSTGSAQNKQRPVYRNDVDVLESGILEGGTGMPSSYLKSWEQFSPLTVADTAKLDPLPYEPPDLITGYQSGIRDEQYDVATPHVAFRLTEPYPSIIRAVIPRLSTSDGR